MADVVRYVNAASAAGGDGTTTATTGANRAWSGISEAITAAAAGKSTADRWLVYVQGSTAETLAGTITITTALNTTSANPLVFIDTTPGATWSTSRYRLVVPSGVQTGIQIDTGSSPFLEFDGVQIEHQRALTSFPFVLDATLGTGRIVLDQCYVRFTGSTATPQAGTGVAIVRGNTAFTLRITNCMLVDVPDAVWINYSNVATVDVANNTVISHVAGLDLTNLDSGSTVNAHNNLVQAIAGTCYGTPSGGWTTGGNISSDTTSPQTALRSLTATFENLSTRDLRLASSDTTAVNAGVNASGISAYAGTSVASSLDIVGTSRPQGAAWDVGAFELVSGPSGPPDAPTGLSADLTTTPGTVALTWTLPGTGQPRDNVVVQRNVNGGSFSTLTTLGASAVNHNDATVLTGNTYQYRVFASNGAGNSSNSNTVTANFTGAGGAASAGNLFGGRLLRS